MRSREYSKLVAVRDLKIESVFGPEDLFVGIGSETLEYLKLRMDWQDECKLKEARRHPRDVCKTRNK
jgi:hypothetical protein